MERETTHSVLFICRQNLFRSPAAACILRQIAAGKRPVESWRIESAGTWVQTRDKGSAFLEQIMLDNQLTINRNPRNISEDLLRAFQLVLTMEQGQRDALDYEYHKFKDRIYPLSAMVNQSWDMPDKSSEQPDDYQAILELLRKTL